MEEQHQRYAITGRKMAKEAIRQKDSVQQLPAREQIRQKPTMWISDITPVHNSVYCFDGERIVMKDIPDYIEGVERLFIEILSNAVDNCTYSIYYGRKPDDIHISIDDKVISVTNGGCHMPVSKTTVKTDSGDEVEKWIPDILFGELFSSSHYDKVKTKYKQDMGSGGTYGVGATLVNVFSEKFEVIVEDPIEQKRFKRVWSKNIPLEEPQVVEDSKITETRICVTYLLDFPFFGIEKYSTNMQELFAFHGITAGFTAKVPIHLTWQGKSARVYNVLLIRDYASLFSDLRDKMSKIKVIEYHQITNEGKNYKELVENHIEIPKIELLLLDLDTGVFQLTFVNGMITPQHGVHLDETCKVFFGDLLEELNVSLTNGKKYVSLLLSVRVPDPKFRGQCKTYLTSPKPDYSSLSRTLLKDLKSWDTYQRFKAINDSLKLLELKKTDGKKVRRIYDIEQLDDANDAGTIKSKDCTLIIVEGESAASYPRHLRDMMPGGKDRYGIFLLKGKPINAMNANNSMLAVNEVYTNLKQALGLQELTDYSSPDKFKKLRYGHVLLAMDADCDGWHIMGLILCTFYSRFKSLLDRQFISFWRTPILRAVKGSERHAFYTKQQYNKWCESRQNQNMIGWKIKYFKGLASSEKCDIKEDFEAGRNQILFQTDKDTDDSIRLAFDETKSDDRKQWMTTPAADFLEIDSRYHQEISRFVHTGLKTYSFDNIVRSIASVMDGLKESMRKVLTAGIAKFGLDGALARVPASARVMELVAATTENYAYHHGDAILAKVTSNMTRNHSGTNNVPWFQPNSLFGTIEDHSRPAPRYASLGPAWWWSYCYNKEDMKLLEYVHDEDKPREPKFYLPVIAWCLCNAISGVGTGYSTSLPGYNIEEVAIAHLCLLNGRQLPQLRPWWRGFTGTVNIISHAEARKKSLEHHADDILLDSDAPSFGEVCVIEGTYSVQAGGSQIVVTSLPLRTLKEFKNILRQLIEEKVVLDYRNKSVDETVYFEIDIASSAVTTEGGGGGRKKFDIVKKFRLRKMVALTNMVLLDENGIPRRFKNSTDILMYFHKIRLQYYEKRIQLIIKRLEEEQVHLDYRVQLIQAILDGEITYHGKRKQEVADQIREKLPNIPVKLFGELKVTHMTKEEVDSLLREKEKNEAELEKYRKMSKEELWSRDIIEFLKQYRKVYGGSDSRFKDSPW